MCIALDVSIVDVQRRLGHRKPDTTLRVYAHQWKYREARRSHDVPCTSRRQQEEVSTLTEVVVSSAD
jgi:hypothetical protein